MTKSEDQATYSPRLRTGVVLCGSGTAGAYHAGVVRALTEAGIKIDVVAAHGAGTLTALAAAIDSGSKVWDPSGPWTSPKLARAYRWRAALRFAALGLILASALLLSPMLLLLLVAAVYAASFVAALVNLTTLSAALIHWYRQIIELLFDPPILPTMLPRAVLLTLVLIAVVLVAAAANVVREERSRRRWRGAFWWQVLAAPLDADEPVATLVDALWRLVRGASNAPRPAPAEIGRRYVDVLADNLGQPGFHELVLAVHDLDGRRDLVGAVLGPSARAAFEARRRGPEPREAEVVDFTGSQRELLVAFLAGALRLPVATSPVSVTFPVDSFWQGETHRLCDRPELVARLIDELAGIGVEQLVIVSPAPPPASPHGMRARPIALRGRMGELLRSIESSALDDARATAVNRFSGVFVVRPEHNPIGPFDFGTVYDEASDRRRTVAELIQQGYADAYRVFIEPIAAAGERVEEPELSRRL